METLQTLLMAYGYMTQAQKRMLELIRLYSEMNEHTVGYETQTLEQGIQRDLKKAMEILAELEQENTQPLSVFQCFYNGKPIMLHGMNLV